MLKHATMGTKHITSSINNTNIKLINSSSRGGQKLIEQHGCGQVEKVEVVNANMTECFKWRLDRFTEGKTSCSMTHSLGLPCVGRLAPDCLLISFCILVSLWRRGWRREGKGDSGGGGGGEEWGG